MSAVPSTGEDSGGGWWCCYQARWLQPEAQQLSAMKLLGDVECAAGVRTSKSGQGRDLTLGINYASQSLVHGKEIHPLTARAAKL